MPQKARAKCIVRRSSRFVLRSSPPNSGSHFEMVPLKTHPALRSDWYKSQSEHQSGLRQELPNGSLTLAYRFAQMSL